MTTLGVFVDKQVNPGPRGNLQIGSLADCVFGYFADCSTVIMPLFLLIVLGMSYVLKCGLRSAEVQVMSMGFVTGQACDKEAQIS